MHMHRPLPTALTCAIALASTHLATAEQVTISEIMYNPQIGAPEFIEIQNHTATPFDIANWRFSDGITYEFPDFGAGDPQRTFLKPFERILVSPVPEAALRTAYSIPDTTRIYGPFTGTLSNNGERLTVEDKNGTVMSSVSYRDSGDWPVAADGTGHTLVFANTSRLSGNWRNWTTSKTVGGTPGSPEATEAEEPYTNPEVDLTVGIPFIDYGDKWDFHDLNQDLGSTWKDPAYNFNSHPGWTLATDNGNSGGLYGFENSALPSPGIRTDLLNSDGNADHITYYFRKSFNYAGPTVGVRITVDQIVDDGATYYLNGIPIGGLGINAGAGWKDRATRTAGDADIELGVVSISGDALVDGVNVLAAEVHQTNNTSSDCVFGARFSISAPAAPGLVINEILPGSSGNGFVEFHNPTATAVNLSGHHLSDTPGNLTKFTISDNISVPPGGIASVGYAESSLSVSDPTVVYLTAPDGNNILNAVSTSMPLDGRSLGRKPEGSGSWFLFVSPTQDAPNASADGLGDFISLSEVAFTRSTNSVGWIELANSSTSALSLDGLFLSSSPDHADKITLTGNLPAGGYLSFEPAFAADNNDNLKLFLSDGAGNVVAAALVERPASRDSVQMFPAGSGEWFSSSTSTRDTANDPDRSDDIVINEIMYDTPSDHRNGEFVELVNRGASTVDLGGWRFTDGISYTFPLGTSIAPGAFLVVAADSEWMQSAYGRIPVIGNFKGQLRDSGERVRLEDSNGNLADQVDYLPSGDWPELADGDGSSMELRHPAMDNSSPSAWADSDE
ncbi:MAG: lamin tail domain-containing protein, partial [Verrucomicrobiales bacterium]|nr:lamin tail domain-containing protein [Verrucomicrobiales bacterium]